MNDKILKELVDAKEGLSKAQVEMSTLWNDFDKKRKAAVERLSLAQSRLFSVISILKSVSDSE